MARTKQTARKCHVGKGPVNSRIKKQKAPLLGGKLVKRGQAAESSDSELEDVVNTQQFSLRFDDQAKCEEECVQGQIIKCKDCEAILTSQSKVTESKDYLAIKSNPALSDAKKQKFIDQFENVWICEFCLAHNSIPKNLKLPKPENPCFLVEKVQKKKSQSVGNASERMLIFCIDVSGSMDFKPSQNVPTRLQSVKEAISDEISRMKAQKQKIKVGLITFGNHVTLVGDGKDFEQQKMDSKLYHSFDGIVDHCSKITNFCQSVGNSYANLKKIVDDLATYGATALGPALVSAIEIASKGAVGSKIIICTDGQANVGIGGNLSADRLTFYNKLSQFAKKKSVMINVLSLKGDRCNLKQLGKLSLATGGAVMKIDPNALGTQFSKITQQNVLGINSELIIKLNKIFRICHANKQECSADMTTLTQDFGNFTAETELTFQFQVINKEDAAKIPAIDIDLYDKQRVPMQIQLKYTGRDGSKYLQVITDWRQLTNDAKAIYDDANFGLFAASILQRASKKIKNQEFKDAQAIINGYWSLVKETFSKTESKEELEKFQLRVKKIERVLNSKMIKAGVRKEEMDYEELPKSRGRGRGGARRRGGRSGSRQKKRQVVQSDSEEQVLWNEMRARSRSISPQRKKGRGKRN